MILVNMKSDSTARPTKRIAIFTYNIAERSPSPYNAKLEEFFTEFLTSETDIKIGVLQEINMDATFLAMDAINVTDSYVPSEKHEAWKTYFTKLIEKIHSKSKKKNLAGSFRCATQLAVLVVWDKNKLKTSPSLDCQQIKLGSVIINVGNKVALGCSVIGDFINYFAAF